MMGMKEMMFPVVGLMVFFFFSTFSSSTHAATDPADASSLNVMFISMNYPYQLTKWVASGGDPCGEEWKGVTCSGSAVTEIKISDLELTGTMGYQLASMTSLRVLDVSNNKLGNLPYNLPPNLTRLNIAGNGFNGGIPYSISLMTTLKYLDVSHNQFQNQLDDMFGKLSDLSTLDLSYNVFPGVLPNSFSLLSSMNNMFLDHNQFTGPIDVLATLPLTKLTVANNRFTGWIPQQLKKLNLQTEGNSFESGPAPPPPPGSPGTPTSGQDNQNNNPSTNNKQSSSGGKSGIVGGVIAGILIFLLVVGAIIAFLLLKRRRRRSERPIPDVEKPAKQSFPPPKEIQEIKAFQTSSTVGTKTFETPAAMNLKPPPMDHNKSFDDKDYTQKPIIIKKVNTAPIDAISYSIADLQVATGSFSVDNLLGEGTFGRVYRAQFNDGKVLAVKKISSSILSDSYDFIDVVSNMSRLHHPNVTELVGYCSEHGQHLLVHEYHKNGSLHDYLHLPEEYTKPLIWNTRVKVALGTARALEYLHEVCSPSIVHKNFKSSNILLGVELNPHLTDCGLASFLPNADQALIQDAGSAPEIALSGQYTLKSDVHSFGVVMLELLTGRKPFDSSRSRFEQSLVRWATPQLHDIDALEKMVDPTLKGLYPVKSLSRFADVIALCVQAEPEFRPPMSEVVQALVRLVQRANMSRRTTGNEQGSSQQADEYPEM